MYKISKKSGDWYYINNKGWFTLGLSNSPQTFSMGETSLASFTDSLVDLGMSSIQSIPLRQSIVPISPNVRPGNAMQPLYITIHNTANTDKGAGAKQHAAYLQNQANGGSRSASWHYTVDDREIYQHLPLNENGWHAGDGNGPGNRSSIGIEIAENSDGNYAKAENNAAKLTAQLLNSLNLPIEAVVPHKNWSGKNCPARILGRPNGWGSFIQNVRNEYDKLANNNNNNSNTSVKVNYQSHIQDIGWQDWKTNGNISGTEGQSKRLESMNIKLDTTVPGASIKYRTHVQDIGWQEWVSGGKVAGTVGQKKRMEAIQIEATGLPKGQRIEYRTHIQDYGWENWKQNGEISGTVGKAKRIEAIQIRIVEDKLATGVTYQSYVQGNNWQKKVVNGATSGTEGASKRIESIKMDVNEPGTNMGIKYQTHVQDAGWLPWKSNGAASGTAGSGKRMEAIRISLENAPKGYSVEYRTHVQDIGWTAWKRDGEISGTEGKSKRIEAIQVRIKKK